MIQYTTTQITFTVEGVDLTENKHVWVTICDSNRKKKITYENPSMTLSQHDTIIVIKTTQEESAAFKVGDRLTAMTNWMTPDGERHATTKDYIVVEENLEDRILTYE